MEPNQQIAADRVDSTSHLAISGRAGSTPVTVQEIKQAIRDMDPGLKDDDPTFAMAVLLLAASVIGPVKYKLKRFTGYSQTFVHKAWKNFRRNGIFVGATRGSATVNQRLVADGGWDDKEAGGIAFWCDVFCGEGLIERTWE